MKTPDLTQRVIGYRRWTVNPHRELMPVGTTISGPWKPGPQHAKCWATCKSMRMPCLHVADPECHCGFYAMHDQSNTWGYDSGAYLQGIVTGWGRLAVHSEGFRAEWIEVMAIILPRQTRFGGISREVAEKVAKVYGVPVVEEEDAESFAMEFGSPLPESLKPSPLPHFYGSHPSLHRLQIQRLTAYEEARLLKLTSFEGLTTSLTDILSEIDVDSAESMAGLYDLYVPNQGDLLTALTYPPETHYVSFPKQEIPTVDLSDTAYLLMESTMGEHISTRGHIMWLPNNPKEG